MGLIYVDSCTLIYAVEDDREWGAASKDAIAHAGDDKLAISPLVKLECLVAPYKRNDLAIERRFLQVFDTMNSLEMAEPVYLKASEIRARFGLKTPDALHLACAQHHRCDAIWTNDSRLDNASRGLARNIFA